MNEEMILTNYLMLLKSCVEVYVHGTIESSNDKEIEILKDSLLDILDSKESTYELMVKNNYYVVDNIKCSDIKKVYDKLVNKQKGTC